MVWWSHLSALGGLNVTGLLALVIAGWLVAARCWRLALAWSFLLGAALALAVVSQMAFIGWGVGIRSLEFTGFSGHATRAAAVFPVALFLLVEREGERVRKIGVGLGVLLAVGVAIARVKVGAHSPSEALAGCLLGLATAGLFMVRAQATRSFSPQPLLVGLLAATVLLPRADPLNSHQWLTAAALKMAGRDRVYSPRSWQPSRWPYVPPCSPDRVRFDYLCT